MSLSIDRPVPVVPYSKYPPQGVPIGSHAFVLKMTPEALDELAAQLATQQANTLQNPNGLSGRPNDKKKKDDKPVMQLVVGETGQQQFLIGGQVFKVEAINEQTTCEIYARHQSPAGDLDQSPNEPSSASAGPLQMIATVDGRLHVKREYNAKAQQVIGERTSKMNKDAQPRSAIIIDPKTIPTNGTVKPPSRSLQNKTPPSVPPVASTSSNGRAVQTAPGVFTPPKSDGSPSSSTSVIRGQKHVVPVAFNTLDLTIPTDWTGPIPVAIRVIHTVVLSPKIEYEVLKDMGVTDAAEQKEALRACGILCDRQTDSTLRLKDEAYYYLRPFLWVHYSPTARSDVSKNMRIALRKLGYDDNDEVWEFLRRGNGWVDPWKSTPEGMNYYREKEQRKTATSTTSGSGVNGVAPGSSASSKEDREKLRAEALANPAPMLTSSIKPGFFASNSASTAKGKKSAKDKEPKEPKEPKAKKDKATKAASKKANDSESGSQSTSTLPPTTSSSLASSQSQSSISASKSNPETAQSTSSSLRHFGPGSAKGKLAAAKRLQKEKEEGRASTVSTPTRSPHSLPAAPNSANTSVAGTPTTAGLKRKADDDDRGTESAKKRKLASGATSTSTSTPTAGSASTSRHAGTSTPTPASTSSTQTKKRKSDNLEPVPPPTNATNNKTRKLDAAASIQSRSNPTSAPTNPTNPPRIAPAPLPEFRPLAPAPTKSKTSATRDYSKKAKAAWDYSSDEGTSPAPSKSKASFGRSGLVPHHVAPPTTYKGFQAIKLQKSSEFNMIKGIILGEEAKLDNARPGDDASTLMSLPELQSLMRRMIGLKAELEDIDAELKRLAATQASSSSSNSSGASTSGSGSSGLASIFGQASSMHP